MIAADPRSWHAVPWENATGDTVKYVDRLYSAAAGDTLNVKTQQRAHFSQSRYTRWDRLLTLPTAQAEGAGPAQVGGPGLLDHLITHGTCSST